MNTDKPNTDRYKKKWSEGDAAKVQVLSQLHSERRTGKLLNIPQPTVNRLKHRDLSPSVCESIKTSNESVAKALSGIRTKLIGELNKVMVAKNANDYKALATSMGIITDKIQILTGGPTEVVGIMSLVERSDNELDQILHGDVEITDAQVEVEDPTTSDNKANVYLSEKVKKVEIEISNPGADDIE